MAEHGAPNDGERVGANWPKAAEGIQLAGFALFLLLNTTGALPWSFWMDAIALWPLLIMSAGIKIAFEKSRAPWLVLLGPVVILGGLGWLASGRRPDAPAGPWSRAAPRAHGAWTSMPAWWARSCVWPWPKTCPGTVSWTAARSPAPTALA